MTNAETVILAFDTSGPFCNAAIWRDDRVIAESYAEMARGQAETLMPMIADLMAEAGVGRRHLSGIGVGVGPGNFTGLRISVAAARGLALALNRPAIGVSNFDVLMAQAGWPSGSVLVSLPGPRGSAYVQHYDNAAPAGPPENVVPEHRQIAEASLVLGHAADTLAHALPQALTDPAELPRPAAIIATCAARALDSHDPQDRPAPLYVRPPDAEPQRQLSPQILS
ncbi:MAG: tRNA (adenosine(37)-N6)-threonylcarbamoyltransferase complex dimerization subunit type 1 TsaB [Pseudomonadota bacterium]